MKAFIDVDEDALAAALPGASVGRSKTREDFIAIGAGSLTGFSPAAPNEAARASIVTADGGVISIWVAPTAGDLSREPLQARDVHLEDLAFVEEIRAESTISYAEVGGLAIWLLTKGVPDSALEAVKALSHVWVA